MRAVVYTHYGSPDGMRVEQVAPPVPQAGEVLVKMHAASLNSIDWDLLTGAFLNRLEAPRTPKYSVLGSDIAGRVEAVGPHVAHLQPGDEVFGDLTDRGFGALAEYAAVPETMLVRKPASMSFEQAAALPQAGSLALRSLHQAGNLKAGQKLLINGAGGGVGTFALQMAVARGAEVTCVDRGDKLEMLRALGAGHVIDYTRVDFTRTGQRYDLILDVVARRSVAAYRRALHPGGKLIMIGGATTTIFQIMTLGALFSRMSSKKLALLWWSPRRDDLTALVELFDSGTIVSVIDSCYPLHETGAALRRLGEGHAQGKIVITL
jgi:NADPH:quinone reductase-like Zn-dependent oxidoreductase